MADEPRASRHSQLGKRYYGQSGTKRFRSWRPEEEYEDEIERVWVPDTSDDVDAPHGDEVFSVPSVINNAPRSVTTSSTDPFGGVTTTAPPLVISPNPVVPIVRKSMRGEVKHLDLNVAAYAASNAGSVTLVNEIATGSTNITRNGNKIVWRSVEINGHIKPVDDIHRKLFFEVVF